MGGSTNAPGEQILNKEDVRILVASDIVSDAELVRRLLRDEFEKIFLSTDPDRSIEDFERIKPDVLLLAFNSLEKAERYYLGLYRLSTMVQAIPHRTVILCDKDDLKRVYELCKREYFDDYILFWPLTHDTPRLPMSVFHALRQIEFERSLPISQSELAEHMRRIAELETTLERYMSRGQDQMSQVRRSLDEAGDRIGAALARFPKTLADRSVIQAGDIPKVAHEVDQLRSEGIDPQLRSATETMGQAVDWVTEYRQALSPQLESAQVLSEVIGQLRPVVLIVDDDEFQRKLIGDWLVRNDMQALFAASGPEALGMVHRHHPDLILMDIELPGLSGIEAMRHLKSVEHLAGIPILVMTGHSERGIVIQSKEAGALDFIVKPVDQARLLAKVRRCLDPAAEAS